MRALAFVVLCLGSRFGLAYLAYRYVPTHPRVRLALVVLATLIATGMQAHFILGTRDVAFEAGGRVWWNELRPYHAALLTLFVTFALAGRANAWMFLAADATLGAAAWFSHRVLC